MALGLLWCNDPQGNETLQEPVEQNTGNTDGYMERE